MGISSGIVGGLGALSGLFGGGNNMPTAPPSFQMPNQYGAANNLYNGLAALQPFSTLGINASNYGQNIFNTLQQNPYGGGFQQGGVTAGALGQQQALNQYGAGGQLTNLGFGSVAPASAVLNTAFDPQQQLYNQQYNLTQQQGLSNLANAGLSQTPYGQSVLGGQLNNFNIGWQNAQLGRQTQGLQAYDQGIGQAAGLVGQGTQMQAAAPGQYYQSSGLPYSTFNQLGNDQYANLNQLLGAGTTGGNLANLQNTGYLNYLQAGNASNATANQLYGLQLQQQNQGFNQNMLLGSALGNSLYRLGNPGSSPLMGSLFSGGGGGGTSYASSLASGSFV